MSKFIRNNLSESKTEYPFIVLQLEFGNQVSYIRPDIPDKKNTLSESDFIKYIQDSWPITLIQDFEDTFYQFKTIILNRDGSWYIYEQPNEEYTFDQIIDFKTKIEEKERLESQPIIERVKPQLDDRFQKNKEYRKDRFGLT